MALTEETLVDQITVDEFGNVNVRQATRIRRDGNLVSETYHRHVIGPDDPLADEDQRVQRVATVARQL